MKQIKKLSEAYLEAITIPLVEDTIEYIHVSSLVTDTSENIDLSHFEFIQEERFIRVNILVL
jgi:hypothetical protein